MLLVSACRTSYSGPSRQDHDLQTLVQWMTGDFSSRAQSLQDSAFFDIRLHICRIWPEDQNASWLYVEQATAAAENKPYRQRIYQVSREGKGFKSVVFALPEPANWIGAYATPARFSQLKPQTLSIREGCTVYLEKQRDGSFQGSTRGVGCESTLRGAKYAVTTVTITARQLLSWDRGFNENGEQVWGATKGGYAFIKE